MSEKKLSPEEVLLLAQAALVQGTPVKVRSYVKRSTTGKQVIVRQAIRGAAGGTGRTPILPSAQTTPVISDASLKAEAKAAAAGAAVQRAAQLAAQKQAAAALKAQKQQQAAKNKKAKTTTPKAPKTTTGGKPKLSKLGALGALRSPRVPHNGLYALRGRPGRLFPGSRALGNAIYRARRAKQASKSPQEHTVRSAGVTGSRAVREASINQEHLARDAAIRAQRVVRETKARTERAARDTVHTPHPSPAQRALYKSSAAKVDSKTRQAIETTYGRHTEAAHRALEIAAAYRRAHGHGPHSVGSGFHEKLAGEVIKHEAKRIGANVHLSNELEEDNPVILAQEALRIEGYAVEVTGIMNDETANALADFLSKEGVDIDASFE